VYTFITDNQPNQIGGVGQLAAAWPVHRQPEAGVKQERLQNAELQQFAIDLLLALYENEVVYTEALYADVGWAEVITVYCFITDNQPNQIGGVGQLAAAWPVHRQPEAGVARRAELQQFAIDLLLALYENEVVYTEALYADVGVLLHHG
jgi:ribonucleotide reductase beta subunit family protein with ferritin-like domain